MNRKVRALLWALMPFVLVEVIQTAASIFMGQWSAALYIYHFHGSTMDEFLNGFQSDDFISYFLDGTYLIYSAVALLVFGIYYSHHFYKKAHRKYNRLEVVDQKLPEPNISFKGYRIPMIIVGVILFVIGMMIVVEYVISALSVLFPVWLAEFMELSDASGLDDMTVTTILYAGIFGPIVEELGFRGISTEYLKRGFGFWWTCIIQAVLFGVMHMNALQGCSAFVIGLGLGYVYLKTGNIIITMILHMVYNLSTSFISYLPWDQVDAMIPSKFMPEVSFVVLVVGLMASYGGSKILAKSKKGVN